MNALPPELATHCLAVNEDERLTLGGGQLEFLRTWELLTRFLPPPPAVVLDVGGATGVYAFPLARAGYDVHLVDALEHHVATARRRAAGEDGPVPVSMAAGDARRLEHADASADAVLLLGPLYHLTDRDDRLAALREARRVTRPGGTVAAAAISRFASTIDGLARGYVDEEPFGAMLEGVLADGVHRNPDPAGRPEWFTTAYLHRPDELPRELLDPGLERPRVFAVEGPAWTLPDLAERLADDARRDHVLEAVRRIEEEPTIAGASAHLLAFATVPA